MKQTISSTENIPVPRILVNASLHTSLHRLDDELRARTHIGSSFRNPAATDDYRRAAELLHELQSMLASIDAMSRTADEIDMEGY
ncbi:hypothetical protein [Burkholderia pseudomallei]|uniref:hypothetical protein n=1 Tax=Burkholderia pseudomallei TaxID=28450 RepID=UPI0011AB4085|nr:hypothetical protein [Burkholderia pseudomallei]